MKKLYQYKIPSPHCTTREGLILQIDTGWGEIAPLPGFSKETLVEAKKEILSFLHKNIKPTLPSVRFGLSCASKPFDTSPLKVPLCAFKKLRPDCTSLKLKLKNIPVKEAISLVKSYIGKVHLRIDCNRSWTLEEALLFASHFSPSDFEYLEEPVRSFSDLCRFSHLTKFPIAVDESLREQSCFHIPTLKSAIVKPMLMGEIPELPIPVVLSSSYESSLGILQIARFASPHIAHGLDTFTTDFLQPPLQVKNGCLTWEGSANPIDVEKLCLIAAAP